MMKKRWTDVLAAMIVLILGILVLTPVVFLAVKSVSGEGGFTLRQYFVLFSDGGVYFYLFLRSYGIAVTAAIGQTVASVLVGFLLGRFRFRGRLIVTAWYTLILFLPYAAVLLPNYMIMRELSLLNTQLSLILPAVFSPIGVIIMTIFVSSVPDDTLDAALLETGKLSEIVWYIVLPQIMPGVALTMVVAFTEAWNMVEQPQAMMEKPFLHPLSVSMNSIFTGDAVNFAGSFLYTIPPVLLLWSCRDTFKGEIRKKTTAHKEKSDG